MSFTMQEARRMAHRKTLETEIAKEYKQFYSLVRMVAQAGPQARAHHGATDFDLWIESQVKTTQATLEKLMTELELLCK